MLKNRKNSAQALLYPRLVHGAKAKLMSVAALALQSPRPPSVEHLVEPEHLAPKT